MGGLTIRPFCRFDMERTMRRTMLHLVLLCVLLALATPAAAQEPLTNPCTGEPFTTLLTANGMSNAEAIADQYSPTVYNISFELADNDEARAFSEATERLIDQPIAIVLDGRVISVPIVRAAITDNGIIAGGQYSRDEARTLAVLLNAGVLPVDLVIESQEISDPGLVITLAPAVPVSPEILQATRAVIERRVSGLGVLSSVQIKDERIIVNIISLVNTLTPVPTPDPIDPSAIIDALAATAFIEFVDFSQPADCTASMPISGDLVRTDAQIRREEDPLAFVPTATPTTKATIEATGESTPD
jgi:preprotein translocase subunit SecD